MNPKNVLDAEALVVFNQGVVKNGKCFQPHAQNVVNPQWYLLNQI
jgi:hypothetical protein